MASERLDMAIKNFENMNQMVERYTRLCRAYVQLAERFQQLDIEHMKLKEQMVPALKALKVQQQRVHVLTAENAQLRQQQQQVSDLAAENAQLKQTLEALSTQHQAELQQFTHTYEAKLQALTASVESLKPFEQLMSVEAQEHLAEAEQQLEMVEETFREMEADGTPDLSDSDKRLLLDYHQDPQSFINGDQPTEPIPLNLPPANGNHRAAYEHSLEEASAIGHSEAL